MASTECDLRNVKISDIRENPVALRDVNRNTEAFLELVESVREEGILNPIVVRECDDPETGEKFFGLVDGLHRYSAACDAGLETIPANVKNMEDAEVLEAQIIGNIHRIETRPVEYSKQLQKILAQNPTLTSTQLAKKLGKSATWIGDRLGLLKVDERIAQLVDEGKINLSNAFALAKLPTDEQFNFIDSAQTMTPQEFSATVLARKKELDKARREGRAATTTEFQAPIHMRKMKEVRTEMEAAAVGPALVKDTKCASAEEGFALGVQWVLHQDPASVAVAKTKDEERKRELAEKREKAKAAKTKQRAADAAIKAGRLQLEAELMDKNMSREDIDKKLVEYDEANKPKEEATS